MADSPYQPIQTENVNVAMLALAWEMTKYSTIYVPNGITGPEVIRQLFDDNLQAIQKAWSERKDA